MVYIVAACKNRGSHNDASLHELLSLQVLRMQSRPKKQWEHWAGASHHSSAVLWKLLQTAFHEMTLHSALPLKSGRSCQDDLDAIAGSILWNDIAFSAVLEQW